MDLHDEKPPSMSTTGLADETERSLRFPRCNMSHIKYTELTEQNGNVPGTDIMAKQEYKTEPDSSMPLVTVKTEQIDNFVNCKCCTAGETLRKEEPCGTLEHPVSVKEEKPKICPYCMKTEPDDTGVSSVSYSDPEVTYEASNSKVKEENKENFAYCNQSQKEIKTEPEDNYESPACSVSMTNEETIEHVEQDECCLPNGLIIRESCIPGVSKSVWTTEPLPKGHKFGPYKREMDVDAHTKNRETGCLLSINNNISKRGKSVADWICLINNTCSNEESNLIRCQGNDQVTYTTSRAVPGNTELLVTEEKSPDSRPKDGPVTSTLSGEECRLSSLIKHTKIVASEKPHKCPTCGNCFQRKSALNYHLLIHTEPKLTCSRCSKRFHHKSNLCRHMKICCGKKPVTTSSTAHRCNECGKSMSSRHNLKVHQVVHTDERSHKCPHCSKCFKTKRTLKIHKLIHNTVKPHLCSICGKGFTTKSGMTKHMLSHSEDKPHKCLICDKAFKSTNALNGHTLSHTRPHACSVCGRCFGYKSSLNSHMSTHSEDRPYKCLVCGKCFKFRNVLRNHSIIHSDKRSFKCSICDKELKTKGNVKVHMVVHSADRPHKCPYCEKCFKIKRNLRRHLKCHEGKNLAI